VDDGTQLYSLTHRLGLGTTTPTAVLDLAASSTVRASMRVRSGIAPAAPDDGDVWYDGSYLYLRAGGINQPLNAPFGTGTANVLTKWSSTSGLADSALTEASGAIRTLTLTNAGAGATNGNYAQQALTGGTGSGATADIVVAGNVVTALVLRSPGTGYVVGNTLSCATIGGAGFVFTVSVVSASDNASGNVTALRVGAGTTAPISGVDSLSGITARDLAQIVTGTRFPGRKGSAIAVLGTMTPAQGVATEVLTIRPQLDIGLQTGSTGHYGMFSAPEVKGVSSSGLANFWGALSSVFLYDAGTTNGTFQLVGLSAQTSVGAPIGTGNTFTLIGVQSANVFSATNAQTVTSYTAIDGRASFTGAAHAVTTFYGLRLLTPTLSGGAAITNRWAISQEDPLAKSAFYGNFGVGIGVDPGAGKVIASLTLTNGGTGYTNGTYAQVALTTTTGSGSGATADIVVAGGIVTTVVLRNPGQGYAVGDTLSCASIGAGTNFWLTVATTASIVRSDGTVVGSRIGGGTTSPVSAVHANGLFTASAYEDNAVQVSNTLFRARGQALFTSQYLTNGVNQPPAGSGTIHLQHAIVERIDTSLVSGNSTSIGSYVQNTLFDCLSSSIFHWGVQAQALVFNTALTGKTINSVVGMYGIGSVSNVGATNVFTSVVGTQSVANCQSTTAVASIGTLTGALASVGVSGGAHTVTDAHCLDGTIGVTAGTITNAYGVRLRVPTGAGTITTRWGISQEDTLAKNQLLGNVGVGVDPGAGKIIASLTLTAGGTLYTTGTYSQVALTGGTGTGATADIVISGGAVTTVVLRAPGQGYVVGDVLSVAAASVGGTGSGFQATVATTASILRSDGTVVAPRIGAGTTTPRAPMDIIGGGLIDNAAILGGSGTANTIPRWTGATTLGDSALTQSGTTVTASQAFTVNGTHTFNGNIVTGFNQTWTLSGNFLNIQSGLLYLDKANSRVGIGTASPLAVLHTLASAPEAGIFASANANSWIVLRRSTSTVLGYIGTGGLASGGAASDLTFRSESGGLLFATGSTERARINSSGDVGIGTAAPVGRADVAGTSVNQLAWGLLSVRSNDAQGADKGGSIAFGGIYDASNATHWAQISGRKENGTSGQYGGYIAFATRTNGAGANAERARIDSTGRALWNKTATPLGGAITHIVGQRPGGSGVGTAWFATAGNGFALLSTGAVGAGIYNVTGDVGAETYEQIGAWDTNVFNLAIKSGYGLKLPATPGNADTQTLDCYQESTWTPTLAGFGGTNPTVTATLTRVGRLVTITVQMQATGGAQYSGTLGATTLTVPAGMTPNIPACTNLVNGAVANLGNVAAYNDGFIYLPTFALTTSFTFFVITYRV